MNESYDVNEDFIGMYECNKTDAESIVSIIKDSLAQCGLSLANVRGQTYDGASVLQGKISGVATHISSSSCSLRKPQLKPDSPGSRIRMHSHQKCTQR